MEQPLTVEMARGARRTMELIYALRTCGVEKDIVIPQVAVIGDQSSGKSSVLEAICSIPLPRGAGITTRCAIELRLTNTHPEDSGSPSEAPSAKRDSFWHAYVSTSLASTPISLEGKHELEDAIVARAASLVDHRKAGFSKERVIVQVAMHDAPNLTIIDLPGIIRTKTFGELMSIFPFVDSQNRNVIGEVTDLIQEYMAQSRAIILVVIPATQDVATIEALEWASRYDPKGERTIGVITKPDLIDKGAEHEVTAVLENQRKPLRLGYVMVKNRSQRDVECRLSVEEARENEKVFFKTHPIFGSMDASYFGIENLVKKVTSVLVTRVHDELPGMQKEVAALQEECENELELIGKGSGETQAEAHMTLMRIIFEYNTLLTESSAGRYVDKRLWNSSLRLCTHVRDLYDGFKHAVENTRPPFEGDSKFIKDVESDIRNSRGRELPGFLNPRIFESRVARYVEEWRGVSNKLISDVRRLASEVACSILSAVAPEFPVLRGKIEDIVSGAIELLEKRTRSEISAVFEREIGQPFTMNDRFLSSVNSKRLERFDAAVVLALSRAGRDSRGNVREKNVSDVLRSWYQSNYCSSSSQRFRAEAEDMATMLGCYWDTSARRFIDNLVMVIDTHFIRPLASEVQVPLNEVILKVGESQLALDSLLTEDIPTIARRKFLSGQQARLAKARKIIDRF